MLIKKKVGNVGKMQERVYVLRVYASDNTQQGKLYRMKK